MKRVFEKSLEAVMIIVAVFLLGILIPMLISLLLVIFTDTTMKDIISGAALFWVFSVLGWIIAAVYINDSIRVNETSV